MSESSASNKRTHPRLGRHVRHAAILLVTILTLGACNAGGTGTSAPPASAAQSSTAGSSSGSGAGSSDGQASASIDALAPYPSKPGDLPEVRFAQATPSLSFSAAIVARDMNFFEYQGVKLTFIQLQSGSTALQALTGGSIDLDNDASTVLASGVAKGLDLQAIENTVMMTLQMCVRKDWAAAHNVDAGSPLADRIGALKGATIGISGPGGASDLLTRFLLKGYGKLDPDKDAKLISIGGASALPGGLDANQIQAFMQSPPGCPGTKEGMVLVQPSDVPEFKNLTFSVLFGQRDWIEGHEDVAKAAATAIAMGSNFILQHPDKALELLKSHFPKVDPQVMADSFNDTIKPQIPADGRFDAAVWKNTNDVLLDAGLITEPVDTTEGRIWTNQYIGDASVR